MDLVTIKAIGRPYDAGLVYGGKAKDQIMKNLNLYKNILPKVTGLRWQKIEEKAMTGIKEIESFDTRIIEIMKGIADGSNICLNDILVLNYRYEFLFSQTDSCTSIGVQKNGQTIISQNWDLNKTLRGNMLNVVFKIDNSPKIFTQVEAGLLCHRGINSEGIALCINSLKSTDDKMKLAIPLVSVLPFLILNSNTTDKIFQLLEDAKRFSSINYMIVEKKRIFDVEVKLNDHYCLQPNKDGIIIHTNHFLSQRFRKFERNVDRDSWLRYNRAESLSKTFKKDIDIENIKKILKDHQNYPYSICRHEAYKIKESMETLASTIFETHNYKIHYAVGNPCSADFYLKSLEAM